MSLSTEHSLVPSAALLAIMIGWCVTQTKHGSDSNSYDHEGRFVPQSFEDQFAKYDK